MADNMGTLDDRVGHQERAAQSRVCLLWYLQCEPFYLSLKTLLDRFFPITRSLCHAACHIAVL